MNISNRLTLARVFMIPLFMLLMHLEPNLVAATIFALASFTDFLDGYLARKRNEVTTLGKFLDPLADKLLTMAAFLYLVQAHILPAWAIVIILGRETAVTGLRVLAAKDGLVMAASIWGKLKTLTQMVSLIMLLLAWGTVLPVWFSVLAMVLFYVSLVAAVFSGYDYFKGTMHLFK
ncbi:CDP-diacylglycerol--glycerol-3-phosphate 3-phosphatidyltransferase [Clostridia bacterium]|nr:CDP-diacylglycerol--glycerol-3-phosphate 3-phosphatidyltransferase [Clostridia bacterium]